VFRRADNGDLVGTGCIAKAGANGCTAAGGNALDGSYAVAVSPDGHNVYVTSEFDHSISVFRRADNGDLNGNGCIADTGATGCTTAGESALYGHTASTMLIVGFVPSTPPATRRLHFAKYLPICG
jgi:hypothetical protein